MQTRTVEDLLREEYFDLLPEIRHVAEYMETVIKHQLLWISGDLDRFEHLSVKSRIKNCESAMTSLRRKQEGRIFDQAQIYTLTSLRDLAGVRVLAFPSGRIQQVDTALRTLFPRWREDPVLEDGEKLAFKYHGICDASNRITGEYQIVPALIGLFWEVEHSAIYKPSPRLKGVENSLEAKKSRANVYKALQEFEQQFALLVRQAYQ